MKSDCVTEDEGFIGSPFYMAPEMLQEKDYNEKADVYSFGIVVWELYTMKGPYEGMFNCLEDFIDAIIGDEERPDIPAECPITLRSLIESCWQTDPTVRSVPPLCLLLPPQQHTLCHNKSIDIPKTGRHSKGSSKPPYLIVLLSRRSSRTPSVVSFGRRSISKR